MKPLITPAEVAQIAFGGENNVDMDYISEAVILTARRRYLIPVVGKNLCDALERGEYPELLTKWIKPALAMYVKYCMLPSLAAQTGVLGIVKYAGVGFDPADDKSVERLQHRIRIEADALIDAATDFIEYAAIFFPEYDGSKNYRHNFSIKGGIVL